jgi:hypothetical protein
MIRSILDLLEKANGETEYIRIAQGKYKYPESFKEAKEIVKKTRKWQSKK